jgi:hypothetical protein
MAITTDFIGHIGIEPALDSDQMDYLTILREVTGGKGGPPLCSGWVASDDGRSLTVRGDDKYGDPADWLRRLIKRYIKPGGMRADGMVVGCRRDTEELFAVQVRANRVTEKVLWPSSAQPREARPQPPSRTPTAQVIDLAARRAGGR